MGVAEDSPLRNPKQIPYPTPPPLFQSQAGAADKKDTPSIRELVRTIDTHVEMVDLKVTSNLKAAEDVQAQPLPADHPTVDALERLAEDAVQLLPIDLSVWYLCFSLPLSFNFFVFNFSFYLLGLPTVTRLWWQNNGLTSIFICFIWLVTRIWWPNIYFSYIYKWLSHYY